MALAFDATFYLSQNPDVAAAISRGTFASAEQHYNQYGRYEGRNPSAYFDTAFYLSQNPDVAASQINPFQHFLQFGAAEGRFENNTADAALDTNNNNRADEFNSAAYLAANADVANAISSGVFKNAYQHFVLYGQFESRPGVTVGPFTNNGQAPNTGNTVALTSNLDVLSGTTGNDTFIGDNTTVQTADRINGGSGIDTLILSNTSTLPTLSGIERVQFTDNTAARTVDLSGVSGLTDVILTRGFTASSLTTAAGVVTTFDATGASAAVAAATVATSGTATSQTVQLTNGSNITTLTANGAAVTNLIIQSNGSAANTIGALAGTSGATSLANSTLTITGSQKLTVTSALDTDFTKVDASASTGGVDVTFGANNVAATGGSGNDRFSFGANLTASDTVIGGAGTDTVAITGVDLTDAASVAQLNALNTKVSGVEVLEFNGGAAATISGGTGTGAFTNTEITKLLFNTADGATDTINQAGSTRTYAFGELNTGDATINLSSGATSVNVSLEAIADTSPAGNTGADVGALRINLDAAAASGTTSTVNLVSTGPGTVANTISSLNAVAGSTYNITGSHDLTVSALTNGGTVNASAFTGKLTLTGSAANDSITTGTAGSTITAAAGVDTINFSASAGARDVHVISGVVDSANRDIVTGFTVGTAATSDQIRFADADTTFASTGNATIQSITTAPTAAITFNTAANDVLSLNFNLSGTTLGANGATDGTALLAAIGQTLSVSADTNTGYIAAYQNGNAYLYHVIDSNDAGATIQAAEIQLVGVYNNVAVGGLVAGNFNAA